MPQKKNPDAMELIRGKAGKVVADATGLLLTMKGLPLAYNKDMQETQQPVFSAAEQVASMLRVATGYLATVTFNYERMQQAASGGFMNALAAAAYLVRQGVPFRKAHELIGKAVQLCVEKGCELEQLSAEELAQLRHQRRCRILSRSDIVRGSGKSTMFQEVLRRSKSKRLCRPSKNGYPPL